MLDSGNGPVRIWTSEQDELIACLNSPSFDDTILPTCPESFLAESRQAFLLEPVIQLVTWLPWQTHLRNQIGPDTDNIANTSVPFICSARYQVLTESSNAEEVGAAWQLHAPDLIMSGAILKERFIWTAMEFVHMLITSASESINCN